MNENAEKVEKQVDTCNIVLSVLRVVVCMYHGDVSLIRLCLSIVARTAMISVASQVLRKHLHMDLPEYEDFEDEPEDDMMEL